MVDSKAFWKIEKTYHVFIHETNGLFWSDRQIDYIKGKILHKQPKVEVIVKHPLSIEQTQSKVFKIQMTRPSKHSI